MFRLGLTFLAMALACSSGADEYHFLDHEYDRTPLGDAVDKASMRLLKEAYDEKDGENKNVVSSPLGVLLLLSMYSAGAGKAEGIKAEIVQALGSSNYDDLYKSYTSLGDRLASMDSEYLALANKLYVAQKYEVADTFANGPVRSYHSEVEKIDFSNPSSAAAAINSWSAEKTKGHIKEPVSVDAIDPNTAAALVNVIFFQGHWNIPFNANDTEDKEFHIDEYITVQKPMMRLVQPLFYHESPELGAKMIELPYKEKGFRMVIILPDEIDGLSAMMEKIQGGVLSHIFALKPINRDIILEMPKFEIRSGLDLNSLLPKIGVSKIFKEGATDIVKGDAVRVAKAFQEAFVKVDEEGATAGAFTGFIMVPMSSFSKPPEPLEFKIDHPFLFAILHEDVTLFVGTYTQ